MKIVYNVYSRDLVRVGIETGEARRFGGELRCRIRELVPPMYSWWYAESIVTLTTLN